MYGWKVEYITEPPAKDIERHYGGGGVLFVFYMIITNVMLCYVKSLRGSNQSPSFRLVYIKFKIDESGSLTSSIFILYQVKSFCLHLLHFYIH